MSLKAKIEAVVYAAEEPVTLAQLAALFADEALEYRREHQPVLPLEGEVPAQESLLDEGGTVGELGENADLLPVEGAELAEGTAADLTTAEEKAASAEGVPGEAGGAAEEGSPSAVASEPGAAEPDSTAEAAAFLRESPEAAEKRLARVRDREVKEVLRELLDELIREYAQSDRGIEIRQIAGGYRVGTKPEYHDSVRSFVKSLKPPMKLSLQALETLAVIAYKQPVTAPEVSEIRGVDTSGVLGSLISRKLITTAGRKQVIGRPILYKTTKEFLLRFGLKDVNELPSIEEFEKMAGELAEADVEENDPHVAAPEELPFFETGGDAAGEVSESVEPMSQKRDLGHPAESDAIEPDIVTESVPDTTGTSITVTDVVANDGEAAVEADENGFPSEAQTVPDGAHVSPEEVKEDR
jgi:segregation and condensation protein B